MKKYIPLLLFILLLSCNYCDAQLSSVSAKSKDFARFLASKTYFVKTGDEKFDAAAEQALKMNWKITPFEIIDISEFEIKIKEKASSFILLLKVGRSDDRSYHLIGVFNGGVESLDEITPLDFIGYSLVNYYADERILTNCSWRITNMIEGILKAIDIIQKDQIKGNPADIAISLKKKYNARASEIKDRTLLVCEASMGSKFEKEFFTSNYPYKVEFCSKDKIEKAILERSKDYFYFQPTITMNKWFGVIDPSNGDILYTDFAVTGLYIKEKEIIEMVKEIKK
jgi:hypothetical protein